MRFAITVLLLCLPSTAHADLSQCIEATVRISKSDGGGRIGWGSGCVFHVAGGKAYVLTNAHVAGSRPGGRVSVEFWRAGYKSQAVPGVTTQAWYQQGRYVDIAIVEVDTAALGGYAPRPIPLAKVGETVDYRSLATAGCPGATWPTLMRMHAFERNRASGDVIKFTPHGGGGRSGSAIFDAAGTRIVGLLAWGHAAKGSPHNRDGTGADGSYGVAMTHRAVWGAMTGSQREFEALDDGVDRLPLGRFDAVITPWIKPEWSPFRGGGAEFGFQLEPRKLTDQPMPPSETPSQVTIIPLQPPGYCVHMTPPGQWCPECAKLPANQKPQQGPLQMPYVPQPLPDRPPPLIDPSQWGNPHGGGPSPFPGLPPGLIDGDPEPQPSPQPDPPPRLPNPFRQPHIEPAPPERIISDTALIAWIVAQGIALLGLPPLSRWAFKIVATKALNVVAARVRSRVAALKERPRK